MLHLEEITEVTLRQSLRPSQLSLGEELVEQVERPTRHGDTLEARVRHGSSVYTVGLQTDAEGIFARCNCSRGGNCQHVYAVLLRWARDPGAFVDGGTQAPAGRPLDTVSAGPPPVHRPEKLPGWMLYSFAQRQQDLRERLAGWVSSQRLQDLRDMAARRGWTIKGASKELVARQIAERMAEPGASLQAAVALDEEHRRVLAALILAGPAPAGRAEQLARAWGALAAHKQFATYTRHLCELGLAVSAEAAGGYPYFQDLVPDVLARWLLPVVQEVWATQHTLRAPGPGGELALADPYSFARLACEITDRLTQLSATLRPPKPRPGIEKDHLALLGWDYDLAEVQRAWQQKKLRPYTDLLLTVPPPSPWLADDTIARLAPRAGGEGRLQFIYSLIAATGLCLPGSPVTIWPEVWQQFLRLDALVQRAVLGRIYAVMLTWSEVWEVLRSGNPRLEIKRRFRESSYRPDQLRAELAGLRQMVLRILACLPEGQWIELDALYPVLQLLWPQFAQDPSSALVSYPSPRTPWFLAEAGSDKPLDGSDARLWDRAQGAFIRQIIAGPLHWLGFADLRLEHGALVAMRLHGLADLLFDRVEAPAAPRHVAPALSAGEGAGAVVDGYCVAVEPSAIGTRAHELLESIAQLQVATAERFVYRLDAGAVHRSFERGAALPQILDDWQRLLPLPMPQPMREQLEAWWQAYGRVRIYENLTVIEFADDYALAEMKAVTSLAQHIVAEVSPRLVIVPQAAAGTLVAELEKAGYTPKQTARV